MGLIEVFLIGIGLSVDAFAVSLSDGMMFSKIRVRNALSIALTFGIYQAVMPLAGYFCGNLFYEYIKLFDHWIALVLLCFLGGKMAVEGIREFIAGHAALKVSAGKDREPALPDFEKVSDFTYVVEIESVKTGIPFRDLMIQGIATSIDAFAVGIALAAGRTEGGISVWLAVIVIGLTTTAICLPSVYLGKKTGDILNDRAEIFGGIILIGIGVKIFIQHVFCGG